MSELQDELAQDPPDFSFEEPWRIDGFETCQWAMRKLKVAEERLEEIRSQALAEAAKISDWANRVSKSPLRDQTYFTNALRDYMIRVREETDQKSLDLPDGRVESRAIPEKAEVLDADVFKKWASDNGHPEFIRIKTEVDLSALKDAVKFDGDLVILEATGEVIDGLTAIQSEVSVKVTVSR